MNDPRTQSTIYAFMKNPFSIFPQNGIYVNYPDAIHFQKGIQNAKVRDF